MFRAYIGTDAGVCRLEDGKPIPLGLEEHAIWAVYAYNGAKDGPPETDTVLAGSYGEGIFRSENGGGTWAPASEGLTATALRTFEPDPEGNGAILCGTEPARGFRSRDGGKTWQEMEAIAGLPTCSEWFLPYSPRAGALRNFYSPPGRPERLLGSVEVGGLIDSKDGGRTWALHDLFDDDIHHITGHPENPDVLWMALGWAALRSRKIDRSRLGGLARSTDGGKTWTKVIERDYTRAVIVPPSHPDLVLASPAKKVGQQGRIVVSADSGKTWQPAGEGIEDPMQDMVELFAAAPDGSIWACCAQGRLLRALPGEWRWESAIENGGTVRAESFCFVTTP